MGGTCSRVDEQPRAPPVSPKPIYRGGLSVDIPCETAVAGSPALSQGSIPSSSSPTSHPSMYQRRVFPAELREEWLEVLSVDDCSRRSARASRLLAARPEVVRGSPWWWTDDTGSLLHVAAERGDASLLRVILDAGAPDLPLALDADGQAALHVAVANGHLDAARVLVEVAAAQSGGCTALTLPDKYRMTPFHLACENGDVAMAGVLRRRKTCSCIPTCAREDTDSARP